MFNTNLLKNITRNDIIRELWMRGDLQYLMRPKQLEYFKFINSTNEYINVCHWSRGNGKSWVFILIGLMRCIKYPGSRVVYFCKSIKSAREIFVPTFKLLSADSPRDLFTWSEHRHRIDFSNGSEFIVQGAEDDVDKHRGSYADIIVCDESGFWPNLRYAVDDIFMELVRRRGGRIFITTTTPKTPGHDFYHYKQIAIAQNTYDTKNTWDNDNITTEEREKAVKAMGGWDSVTVRRELLNHDVVDSNYAVLPDFDETKHVVDNYERPRFFYLYISMDLGLKDHTHILWAIYDFWRAKIVIEHEYMCFNKTTAEIAAEIKRINETYYPGVTPHRAVSDNEAQQLYDLSHTYGLHFEPANKYDKEASINETRKMFSDDRILIHKRCHNVIHQYKVGVWNNRRSDYERLPGAGHLDGFDATRYLVRAIDYNRDPTPVNYGVSRYTHVIPTNVVGNELSKINRFRNGQF